NAEKAVQAIKNTLVELPASRRVLQAQLEELETGVKGAQLELSKTEIVAPFTMRIREANVALHQAVAAGEVLVVGDGVDVVEVPTQLPVGTLGPLLRGRSGGAAPAPNAGARTSNIEAFVRLETPGVESTWTGRFRRFSGVDPLTRTIGAVIE